MSLFDSLKSKTSHGVSKALSNTEKALRKAEINRQIAKSRDELDALCLQFGRIVHHAGVAAEAEVRSFLESTHAIEVAIAENLDKVKDLEETNDREGDETFTKTLCAHCGAEILPTQKFCGGCGVTLHSN